MKLTDDLRQQLREEVGREDAHEIRPRFRVSVPPTASYRKHENCGDCGDNSAPLNLPSICDPMSRKVNLEKVQSSLERVRPKCGKCYLGAGNALRPVGSDL